MAAGPWGMGQSSLWGSPLGQQGLFGGGGASSYGMPAWGGQQQFAAGPQSFTPPPSYGMSGMSQQQFTPPPSGGPGADAYGMAQQAAQQPGLQYQQRPYSENAPGMNPLRPGGPMAGMQMQPMLNQQALRQSPLAGGMGGMGAGMGYQENVPGQNPFAPGGRMSGMSPMSMLFNNRTRV